MTLAAKVLSDNSILELKRSLLAREWKIREWEIRQIYFNSPNEMLKCARLLDQLRAELGIDLLERPVFLEDSFIVNEIKPMAFEEYLRGIYSAELAESNTEDCLPAELRPSEDHSE